VKLNACKLGIFAAVLATGVLVFLAEPSDPEIWNLEGLQRVPRTFSAGKYTEYQVPGVQMLLYESIPFRGKPTKVFAYYSSPSGPVPPGGWPAVVLVHGGGGTAYADYVKKWNSWGYAAISMDCYGKLPLLKMKQEKRPNLDDGWTEDKSSSRRDETWHYHSVAQIVLAHSLIRSFPEVNPEKIGVVGASWGGVHASIAAAVDSRFKFAVMVYSSIFDWITPQQWWDPGKFIPSIRVPTLWVKGTTDANFPSKCWQRAVNICGGKPFSSLVVGLGHGDNGLLYPINRRFADSIIKDGAHLPKVGKIERRGKLVSVFVASVRPIFKAELCYTCDAAPDTKQVWKALPALIKGNEVSAELPDGATFFFINVFDEPTIAAEQEWPSSSEYLSGEFVEN
jgi:dienelactone hydrolase